MIELAPIENEEYIKNEIRAINDFSDEHRAPDGVGWTDMYIRDDSKQAKLIDRKISFLEFDKLLSEATEKYDKVYTDICGNMEECKNTYGYSKNKINIFVSFECDFVTNIWLDFYLGEVAAAEELYNVLKLISDKYDLIFVHWAWGYYSRIRTDSTLKDVLMDTAKSIAERTE
jgi:hypothetical protein